MPPTLFQAAARASYWFFVDCGPGLYSDPEFGPIAAKTTGDAAPPVLLPCPLPAAAPELPLEHAVAAAVADTARNAAAASLALLPIAPYILSIDPMWLPSLPGTRSWQASVPGSRLEVRKRDLLRDGVEAHPDRHPGPDV